MTSQKTPRGRETSGNFGWDWENSDPLHLRMAPWCMEKSHRTTRPWPLCSIHNYHLDNVHIMYISFTYHVDNKYRLYISFTELNYVQKIYPTPLPYRSPTADAPAPLVASHSAGYRQRGRPPDGSSQSASKTAETPWSPSLHRQKTSYRTYCSLAGRFIIPGKKWSQENPKHISHIRI